MSRKPNEFKLPPGPPDGYDINVDDETFDRLNGWISRYGDIVAVKPLSRNAPSVVINNPDYVKHVLISNHRNYRKGVGFERIKMLLGNGIIVSDGDFWRSQRRMIQPAFHRKVVADLATMMQDCNARKLVEWQEAAKSRAVINITEEMSALALEVVLKALFSVDLDWLIDKEGKNPFLMLVEDFTRDLKLAMRFRAMTRHVKDIMELRRSENRIEHDFLSLLMETRDKDTNEPMGDKALIDEVMTIIVAGHETTAGTLNWAWSLLSQHPDVEARLHHEVDALATDPSFEDLEQLDYARQIAEETLRLYPPVWLFSRKAIHDDVIGGYDIPAGSNIFLCPYLMHRSPKYWDCPETFQPERFTADAVKVRNRHIYYPFSLGSRRCIGEFFSLVDMQLHLGLMARYLRLTQVSNQPVEVEPHINLRSRHPIMMQVHARTSIADFTG